MPLGTMMIKCRTRERERGVTCLSCIKCKTRERGGSLAFRNNDYWVERERGGGSLDSRNNDYYM